MNKKLLKIKHHKFKKHINKIAKEIKDYIDTEKIRIDYVVPVMRGGVIPAAYLSYKLNIVKFAPVQAKIIERNKVKNAEILSNALKDLDKTKPLNLLVVDGVFSTGKTLNIVLEEIKRTLPKAKIILSITAKKETTTLPEVDKAFFGFQYPKGSLLLFPWEIYENELNHPDDLPQNIF